MLICELCKKKPASVHLTNIEKNVKRELHMCEECAQKKGFSIKAAVQLPQVLSGLAKTESKVQSPEEETCCDACGIRWSEFRSGGRFGCANDYVAFRAQLDSLVADIHNRNLQHVGKTPHGQVVDIELRRELIECRRRLREAVEKEAYEDAARLRDRLAELKGRMAD